MSMSVVRLLFSSVLGFSVFALGGVAWAEQKSRPPAKDELSPTALAASVKELFRTRCFECHGGSRASSGVKILDRDGLIEKEKLAVGKPDDSLLFQLLTTSDEDSAMPPPGQPRLTPDDIDKVRRWILGGAPAFPPDVAGPGTAGDAPDLATVSGADYVLKKILEHVRTLNVADRTYVRFFSTNHLLAGGATREELDLHEEAFVKGINHLSLEPVLARPKVIDAPQRTLFAVDIREFGWHKRPFTIQNGESSGTASDLNVFDLALLEYPYGIVYQDSDTFDHLVEEYLIPAKLARPIAYVRVDWFVCTATQPPLYEDFLRLPLQIAELEAGLGVDVEKNVRDGIAKRAGMTVSGVSRNNRVVERHPCKHGAFWQSFDFRSSKGRENIFQDPLNFHATGGEMIFNLPNGLQGYYLATSEGRLLDTAPTDIVTDKFSENKTVRNGLSCMRCHDAGIKNFVDTVRPAVEKLPGTPGFDKRAVLDLYVSQEEMDRYLKEDGERFMNAMQRLFGKPQAREPLIPVSQRFADGPLQLPAATAELGLTSAEELRQLFRIPQFAHLGLVPLASGGAIRRDMWEEYFDRTVAHLGLGVPVAPIDGLLRQQFPLGARRLDITLSTSKKNNVFAPGDELVVFVENKSKHDVYIELIGTSTGGEKVILAPATTVLKAGEKFRFPESGSLKVQGGLGREQITLFASEQTFAGGQLLRGKGVVDRVYHPFYKLKRGDKRFALEADPADVIKQTIEIETR